MATKRKKPDPPTGVRLDAETVKWLERTAKKHDRSVSWVIRSSIAYARLLDDGVKCANPALQPHLDELRAGLGRNPGGPPRTAKKELARERRRDIRTAVFLRAGGVCECGCGEQVRDDRKDGGCFPEARGEVDHFFGRGAGRPPESEQTCWVLRPACHREKTLNRPDAATWLRRFMDHAMRRGYYQEAKAARDRLTFVETRANLPASPRVR